MTKPVHRSQSPLMMIIYSTRRGSTELIAREIARGLGGAELVNLSKGRPKSLSDFVVVGSPIYYERPLPEVTDFIRCTRGLGRRVVAVFIVCMADVFGFLGRRVAERIYLNSLKKLIKGEVISERIFRGWLRGVNRGTLKEAYSWGATLAKLLKDRVST